MICKFKAWVFVGKTNHENADLRLFLAWWGACHCLKESRKEIIGACVKLGVPVSLSKSETQACSPGGLAHWSWGGNLETCSAKTKDKVTWVCFAAAFPNPVTLLLFYFFLFSFLDLDFCWLISLSKEGRRKEEVWVVHWPFSFFSDSAVIHILINGREKPDQSSGMCPITHISRLVIIINPPNHGMPWIKLWFISSISPEDSTKPYEFWVPNGTLIRRQLVWIPKQRGWLL